MWNGGDCSRLWRGRQMRWEVAATERKGKVWRARSSRGLGGRVGRTVSFVFPQTASAARGNNLIHSVRSRAAPTGRLSWTPLQLTRMRPLPRWSSSGSTSS
eukprot:scaffold31563_cov27-Tisochrysis_lutea.AAC.3